MIGKAKIIPVKNTLFLPYQEKWIKDTSQIKIMEKSRQIGISWSTAYSLVERKAKQTAKLDAWCSSRDDAQARLLLSDCSAFAKILQAGAQDLGEMVIDKERDIRSYVLKFANELQINSMSSNPDAQAGKRGDRVLDEFALHKDPKKLYDIAYPGITWGGQLEIISTHRGDKNFFNILIKEIKEGGNPKNISLHTVTLETALNQGFLYKLQRKLQPNDPRQMMDEGDYFNYVKSTCSSDEGFQQEFMCNPASDSSLFIEVNLLAQCEYDYYTEWEKELDACVGDIYIGMDIARTGDFTCLWVIEVIGDVAFTRKVIELRNTPFREQRKALNALMSNKRVRRVAIDKTGMGIEFSEESALLYGENRVDGVHFNPASKERMAFGLRHKMEKLDFRMPFSVKIREDFGSIKKEISSNGNLRFSADRGPNGHADRFWAAALAVSAIGKDDGECMLEPLGRAEIKRDDDDDEDNQQFII